MVPPSQKGLTYYFSLLNPRNFRHETFIDKTMPTTYVEKDPLAQNKRVKRDTETSSDEDEPEALPFPKFVNIIDRIKQAKL